MSLATELLRKYESKIEALTLVPSHGGCFEVTANEQLVFSKLNTGRHAEAGEVLGLIEKLVK